MIDKKYKISAHNKVTRKMHTEEDSVLFLAQDKALPATLKTYRAECERLGSPEGHLEMIDQLSARIEAYQEEITSKVPD